MRLLIVFDLMCFAFYFEQIERKIVMCRKSKVSIYDKCNAE